MRDLITASSMYERAAIRVNSRMELKTPEWINKQVRLNRISRQLANTLILGCQVLQQIFPDRWDMQMKVDLEEEYIRNRYYMVDFAHDFADRIIREYDYSTWEKHLKDSPYRYYRELSSKDVVSGYNKKYTFSFIIHWPEVTIRNNVGSKHLIRDLFIKLNLGATGFLELKIEGTRSTLTTTEAQVGYYHSHLKARNGREIDQQMTWGNYCKGSGVIVDSINYFNADRNEGNLIAVLYNIQRLAEWESLTGGPHIRMGDITARTTSIVTLHNDNLESRFSNLKSVAAYAEAEIDWVFSSGVYTIVDNDNLEAFCMECLRGVETRTPTGDIVVYKEPNGRYYRPGSRIMAASTYQITDRRLLFRGQDIAFKIIDIDTDQDITQIPKEYIHPQIRAYVKSKLEQYAKEATSKRIALSRIN